MKTTKKLLVLVFVCLSEWLNAQSKLPTTDQYANFRVAGNSAIWTKHYDAPGVSIKEGVLSSANLKNLQESEKIYADMIDFIPKKGADLFSGKAIFTTDSTGYWVVLKDITMKFGADKVAAMAVATGVQNYSRVSSFDDVMVKDGLLKPKGKKSLEILNDAFTKLFKFQ